MNVEETCDSVEDFLVIPMYVHIQHPNHTPGRLSKISACQSNKLKPKHAYHNSYTQMFYIHIPSSSFIVTFTVSQDVPSGFGRYLAVTLKYSNTSSRILSCLVLIEIEISVTPGLNVTDLGEA